MTDRNAAWRAWYRRNARRKMAWQARRREELRAWMRTLKAELACARCGERALECLQFHHSDPQSKDLDLSAAVTNGWAKQRILDEIAKCEVLCANCHLKHHWRGGM